MSGCLRFITPIAFLRRYDYEFIWISFSLIVSLLFMYRCTMFACAHIAVIKTRANNREIQPSVYRRESFLVPRDAICVRALQNFTRRFIPVRLFITEDCVVTYLTYFLLFRVSDPKPYPVLLICAYLTRAGWKNSRSEKTR